MAVTAEALEVILRLSRLPAFTSGMREASREVVHFAAAEERAARAGGAMSASQKKTMGMMTLVKKSMGGIALATAATGVAAYKLGVDFDRQMSMIQTEAGAGADEVKTLREEVLKLAGPTAQSPIDLSRALYSIESTGLRGSAALDALKASADAAGLGNANLEHVASALAGVLKVDMPGAANTAAGVMAQLNAAVGTGNMRMDDLTLALGTGVLPAAKNYGLQLQDIMGALAIFTDEHMQGSSAMAQFATSFHFLTGATKGGEEALQAMGLSGAKLSDDMRKPRGMLTALRDLKTHLDAYSTIPSQRTALLNKILPGGRGRILVTLMNQLDNYSQKMDDQERIQKEFAHNVEVYHRTAAYKLRKEWEQTQADLIRFYDTFKGPATVALVFVLRQLNNLLHVLIQLPKYARAVADAWGHVPQPIKDSLYFILLMTGTFGAILMFARAITILQAAWAAVKLAIMAVRGAMILLTLGSGPVMLGILAVAFAVWMIYRNWDKVKHGAQVAFDWIAAHWPLILAILTGPFGLATLYIVRHFGAIKGAGRSAAHWVGQAFSNSVHWIANRFRDLWRFVKGIFDKIEHAPGKVFDLVTHPGGLIGKAAGGLSSLIPKPHFATGVEGFGGGFATINDGPSGETVYLPGGSSVQPSPASSLREPRAHTPNPTPLTQKDSAPVQRFQFFMDGKEITGVVVKRLEDRKARK